MTYFVLICLLWTVKSGLKFVYVQIVL